MKRRAGLFCMILVLLLLPAGNRDSVAVGGGGVVRLPDRIPLVALTFDDGPRPDTTGALLDGLALREVPATFFLVGERIEGSEELLLRMKQEGHQIGIHTYDHVLITQLTREEFNDQMDRTRQLLTELLGPGEYWLRPPYGLFQTIPGGLSRDGPFWVVCAGHSRGEPLSQRVSRSGCKQEQHSLCFEEAHSLKKKKKK